MDAPEWEFQDSLGIVRRGYVETTTDRGGTDVSYFFRDIKNGRLYVVPGSLVAAHARPTGSTIPMLDTERGV